MEQPFYNTARPEPQLVNRPGCLFIEGAVLAENSYHLSEGSSQTPAGESEQSQKEQDENQDYSGQGVDVQLFLQQALGGGQFAGQSLVDPGGHVQRPAQCFEEGFRLVVVVIAVENAGVQVEPGFDGQ
jgi:hypothetical protein